MLVGVECMFAAMLEQVTCMTMSPHMLHAHTHTHTHAHSQLAQQSTQLAQAYTCFTNNKSPQENSNHYNTTLQLHFTLSTYNYKTICSLLLLVSLEKLYC